MLSAQNLVPNPSFELFDNCPPYPGQIHNAVAWDSPNNNTTDYFHPCSPKENGASVPENLLGNQIPATGQAYAGIRTWIPTSLGNPIYREYLGIQLLAPLQANQQYVVRFEVSLAETSSHTSDDLGIYFSAKPFLNERLYEVSPQVQHPKGNLIEDTENWISVAGVFQATGGEQYIIIGNFQSDENMTRRQRSDNKEPKVYFYIDDIVVEPCAIPTSLIQTIDTIICKDSPIQLQGLENAIQHLWNDKSISAQLTVNQAGTYSVISSTYCYDFTTIYQVVTKDCTCTLPFYSPQSIDVWLAHINQFSSTISVEKFRLLDVLGRQLFVAKSNQFAAVDDLHPPAGTYFYEIEYICKANASQPKRERFVGKWILVE